MPHEGSTTLDNDEFIRLTEPFRPELLAHCYRLLGSVDDAEDLVQETYLRAWRSYGGFEGRSSLRTWLYRIATNACLTVVRDHSRRVLPSGIGDPCNDPDAPAAEAGAEIRWLQPLPDAMVSTDSGDPAAIVAARDHLRLALIACLQLLPPQQRAVLILRDVLAFPAAEVAAMLDTTAAAVQSALQRARARIDRVAPVAEEVTPPEAPQLRALLDQYVAAFETSDLSALEKALRKDATIEMVGSTTWFSGNDTCLRFVSRILGSAGDWRMLRTTLNGQPGVAAYRRGSDGAPRPFGVAVLDITHTGIASIVVFSDPQLITRFGFPPVPPAA
jgi:RNA polymerase sigma-70 factor (ECF subfamily)